jgi:hypothetical protein
MTPDLEALFVVAAYVFADEYPVPARPGPARERGSSGTSHGHHAGSPNASHNGSSPSHSASCSTP